MFRQVTGERACERALLTPLAPTRAFQPQAVGFHPRADDLVDHVSPTATSDSIGPKTRPRYAG